MKQVYSLPVAPDALETALSQIRSVYAVDALKREALPARPEVLGSSIAFRTRQVEREVTLSGGYGGFFSVSSEVNYARYAYDALSTKTLDAAASQAPVMSVTYGAGVRLIVEASSSDSEIDLTSIADLAAHVQLKTASANMALEMIGMDQLEVDIPDGLFTFEAFTQERLTKANTLIDRVTNLLEQAANRARLQPQVVALELQRRFFDEAKQFIVPGNLALWRIRKGESLAQCLSSCEDVKIRLDEEDRAVIRRVYALIFQREELAITGSEGTALGQEEPRLRERRDARAWMNRYRFLTKNDEGDLDI